VVILLIICGLPFAGKTTLEQALLHRFALARVDVDDTKRELFGPTVEDAELSQNDWVQVYAEADERIGRYLAARRSVVDASRNFRRDERTIARQIAATNGANLMTIFIDTPEEVVRGRLVENRIAQTRHDVADAEFDKLLREMEPPTPDESPLVLRHGDDLNQWVTQHLIAVL